MLLFSCPVKSNSFQPHGLQDTRPPCPSPSPEVCPSSCPLHRWCHSAISSSDAIFSFCPQSLSGIFPTSQLCSSNDQNTGVSVSVLPMSWLFASDDQNTGISASASVFPTNIQDWFPLGWTGWISLQSKGHSRVFNTTVRKHQFFGTQPSLWTF